MVGIGTENKNPMPGILEYISFHKSNPIIQYPSKRPCNRGHTKKYRDSQRKFIAFVKCGQVKRDAGEISRFHYSQENSCNDEACKILDEAHQCHYLQTQYLWLLPRLRGGGVYQSPAKNKEGEVK